MLLGWKIDIFLSFRTKFVRVLALFSFSRTQGRTKAIQGSKVIVESGINISGYYKIDCEPTKLSN